MLPVLAVCSSRVRSVLHTRARRHPRVDRPRELTCLAANCRAVRTSGTGRLPSRRPSPRRTARPCVLVHARVRCRDGTWIAADVRRRPVELVRRDQPLPQRPTCGRSTPQRWASSSTTRSRHFRRCCSRQRRSTTPKHGSSGSSTNSPLHSNQRSRIVRTSANHSIESRVIGSTHSCTCSVPMSANARI